MQELILGVMYKDRQEESENMHEDEKEAQNAMQPSNAQILGN